MLREEPSETLKKVNIRRGESEGIDGGNGGAEGGGPEGGGGDGDGGGGGTPAGADGGEWSGSGHECWTKLVSPVAVLGACMLYQQ